MEEKEFQADRMSAGKVIFYIASAIICIAWIFPVLWLIATSLKPEGLTSVWPPEWIADETTFENYVEIFRRFPTIYWLRNSIIVTVIANILVVFLGSLVAYSFSRFKFKLNKVLFLIAIATLIIPQEITIVPLYIALSKLGLSNTYFSLIMPAVAGPMSIFLFKQFFDGFPKELEEAALIDGCSRFRIYWNLILPLSGPVIAAVTIITFSFVWNDLMWPLIITATKDAATLPVGIVQEFPLSSFAKVHQYAKQASISFIAIIPTLLLFLALQRHFVRGIISTGIKG